jgi:UV DNA damage repair endonuclease
MNTTKRIGFACKWIDSPDQVNGIKPTDDAKQYNTGSTTVAWLNRQTKEVAEQKLWDLMVGNIESIHKLIERVGKLNEQLRMVRISSDILPVYTQSDWSYFWRRPDVSLYCEKAFGQVGQLARMLDVRLSFHPGQFCCIVSDNPDVVYRSIEELEYHADMIRWMGYGQKFQDFKCNVHLSGRMGVDGFDAAWQQMSPELRNCLTLENDEYQKNIDELIKLKDKVAIVLDIHHHLISDSEYITVDDHRIKHIIDSWRGVRPVIHYSQSREEYIGAYLDCIPEMFTLLKHTKRAKLRAHSDFYNNRHINAWALTHLEWADMMSESKSKNLGSLQLFNQWQESI